MGKGRAGRDNEWGPNGQRRSHESFGLRTPIGFFNRCEVVLEIFTRVLLDLMFFEKGVQFEAR